MFLQELNDDVWSGDHDGTDGDESGVSEQEQTENDGADKESGGGRETMKTHIFISLMHECMCGCVDVWMGGEGEEIKKIEWMDASE